MSFIQFIMLCNLLKSNQKKRLVQTVRRFLQVESLFGQRTFQ